MIQQFCAWSCYVECSRFLHDRSPMNDLLLNDQQQLNVVFDYGNLHDVLLILMSVLVFFTNITLRTVITRNSIDSSRSISVKFLNFWRKIWEKISSFFKIRNTFNKIEIFWNSVRNVLDKFYRRFINILKTKIYLFFFGEHLSKLYYWNFFKLAIKQKPKQFQNSGLDECFLPEPKSWRRQ